MKSMTKRLSIALLLAAVAAAFAGANALAQDLKIGYIDSQRIFAEFRETQEAEKLYKKEVEQWKAEAAAKEQEITKLQEELRAQSLMLSEEKQKEKKLEIDRKLEDYQRFVAETFGEEGIAAKRNRELTQPIVERIKKIVFDVANANIVYAKKELDLTDKVLEELNKVGP
jgi:outer membrane protein